MKKFALLIFLFAFVGNLQAQKIFAVDYASQAEVKVFVVKYESQADLKYLKLNTKVRQAITTGNGFLLPMLLKQKRKSFL